MFHILEKEVFMPMKFVRVLRKITVGALPGMKFLLRQKKNKVITTKQIAERIAETSAWSKGDVFGLLMQYETVIEWELMEGNPVQLGEIGVISPEFSAKAVDTLEEANASTITRKFIRLRPKREFAKKMKNIPVEYDNNEDIKGLQLGNPEEPTNP